MSDRKVLILGAGPAGLTAAEAAASLGAKVTLAGRESYPPYWRPRLTRALSEPVPAEALAIKKPEWYAERNIRLLISREAAGVRLDERLVLWKDGAEPTAYDSLVLAAGATPNLPAVAGVTEPHALRCYDDTVVIRSKALEAGRAVVLGGGLLGLETAWELNRAGVKTVVIERAPWLMPRQLNRQGGMYLQRRLESAGMYLITDADASQLQEYYPGACVILCAGVQADLTIVRDSGIAANRAVVVDERMATSVDGVYACGDIAEYRGRCWGLMAVAQEQGRVADANAAGGAAIYVEAPPSPMLKVGAVSVFSVGDVAVGEGVTELSQENDSGYRCLMLKDDILVGAVLVGDTAAGMKLKKAVAERRSLTGVQNAEEAMKRL